ncbi:pentachlorophenol monooxygenase [Nocardia panacis]|uniref:Pentachlorophenol monooxygenase n=1 Tax=Nocardia panacis TaxID=2340916 RepID=A0A3A4K8A4_9NOCA|nr:FAD-dependent monooxygenase [Nocardia panacis]RJO77557.1 pentachlorophenol monooxygenase [Nocardia panacis]
MHAEVAVIGNGPVGQTTALLLARWGIRVLLLDRRPSRDAIGSKAICQQRDVLDIWAAVGAGARIAEEGLTWTTARTFYRDRELFSRELTDPGCSPFPPFVNLSQSRTERILDERIAAEPRIEVRWDHLVTDIAQHPEGITLRCTTSRGQTEIATAYAVACAGAQGAQLRRLLGIGFEGESFDDRFLICDIRTDLPDWSRERRFYFDPEWNPGRQVLIHPCPDSTFRIDWQVPGDYDLDAEESTGELDARIRRIIGDRPYGIVWKSVYRFHSRIADRLRAGRVLLAGDCAHLVAPFGARGLNSGVADAENAAWKLAFVLRGWAPEALLDSYHAERHAAARENIDITTHTMDFLVPRTPELQRRRRETLDAVAADPTLADAVDSGRLCEPHRYVESPLTTANPEAPIAPGTLVPDVPITLDGSPTRLRAIARDGFLVVTTNPGAVAPDSPFPLRVVNAAGTTLPVGAVFLIRPDAHVAAVLPSVDDLPAALRRATARQ